MPDFKVRAAFTIAAPVKEELEAVVPKSKRSQFVEQAIAAALLKEAKRKALAAIDNAPCVGTDGKDSVAVLSDIRRSRTADLATHHQG